MWKLVQQKDFIVLETLLYHQLYFATLDLVITGIIDCFDQPGYVIYKNLEGLLIKAANNLPCDDCMNKVVSFYRDDFNPTELTTQLKLLDTYSLSKAAQDLVSPSRTASNIYKVCQM